MTKARDLANASTALSAVSATELAFVDGVTSAIQTQLDAKATLTGTETFTNKTLTSPVLTTPTISTVNAKGDLLVGTADNTVDRLAVGSNGETLVADSSTSTGLRYQGNYAAGKNKIINGDFGIWQRGTSFTNPNDIYVTDRWIVNVDIAVPTWSVTQQTFTPGAAPVAGYEGRFFLRAAVTAIGASTAQYISQRIEDVRTYAGETVTVSFYAKFDTARTLTLLYQQNFGSGGSATVTGTISSTVSVTNAFARYSVTFAVPSLSGKTIGTGSSLIILFKTPAANYTLDLWGVQLEASNTATAFQTATGTIQGELAACQRYYFRMTPGSFDAGNTYGVFGSGYAYSTSACEMLINAPVQMRVRPTVLDYSSTIPYDGVALGTAFSALAISNNSTPLVASISATGSSGLTQYRTYTLHTNNSNTGFVGLGAEL